MRCHLDAQQCDADAVAGAGPLASGAAENGPRLDAQPCGTHQWEGVAMFEDSVIADYLRRAYFAVDGLWFVKVEERLGFDEAIALDRRVWSVLAKIEARQARALLGLEEGRITDMAKALELKFTAERYGYTIRSETRRRVEIKVTACPWLELLRKSGREHLADAVGMAICPEEYRTWADEFDPGITVSLPRRLCAGDESCRLILESSQDR